MTSNAISVGAAGPRVRSLPRPDRTVVAVGALALVLLYLAGYPLAMLFLGSFGVDGEIAKGFTLEHYVDAYGARQTYEMIGNSLLFAFGTGLLALTLGTLIAWIVERTDTPLRRFFFGLVLIPIIVPGVVSTISWVFLLSGRIGIVAKAYAAIFGLDEAPFTVYSMPGMIWVEGLHLSPLVFLLMSAAFKNMDPSLEEAAHTSGSGTLSTLRRVTLPLLAPALASAGLVMAIRGLESFEVARLIGVPAGISVFTAEIYRSLHARIPDYGLAGAQSMTLLLITVAGVFAYQRIVRTSERFATVTGKAFRPRVVDLGRLRYVTLGVLLLYALLIIVLPFAVLMFVSLVPFYAPDPALFGRLTLDNYVKTANAQAAQRGALNSLLLGAAAATTVTALTAVVAWVIARTKVRGRGLLDALAFVPITVPGVVLGVALILEYLSPTFRVLPIYGTLWILLIAYLVRYMPYGMRANSASIVQLHRELEEASATAGASWWRTFRTVTLPLLRPALVAAWLYIFIVSVRELGASVLLTNQSTTVLAVTIFEAYEVGSYGRVASLSVMLIVTLVVVVTIVQRVSSRFGIRE